MPVGLTLAPIAADAFGIDATLAACAALTLVANLAILLVPSVRSVRRGAPRGEPAAVLEAA
jgi:hypothetical protein